MPEPKPSDEVYSSRTPLSIPNRRDFRALGAPKTSDMRRVPIAGIGGFCYGYEVNAYVTVV